MKPRVQAWPEMTVFGVSHATGKYRTLEGRTIAPNNQVSVLFRELRKAGSPQKFGVEFSWEPVGWKRYRHDLNVIMRYFKAVELKARKSGMNAIPLNETTISYWNLENLQPILGRATKSRNPRKALWRELSATDKAGGLYRMIEAILKKFPQMNRAQANRISDAVAVQRSLRMYEEALSQGVKHMVVGATHAADL